MFYETFLSEFREETMLSAITLKKTMDPTTTLTAAIENASKVANTPLFTTIIDKVTGFKISEWAAQGELRKKILHDEYEKAKENGIMGMEFIKSLRQTSNLIDTATKSTKYINQEKQNDIQIDNDFFWNTIEHAKTISNEDIQELIAKIIAGEYNQPGSYSMSTLHTIKLLGKVEIEIFEKLGSLLINDSQIPHEIFGLPENVRFIMNSLNIDFGTLQLLQSLGLVLPNEMTNSINNPTKKNYGVQYFGNFLIFKPKNETNYTPIILPGYYELSSSGKQIMNHLNPQFNSDYFNWLKSNLKIDNYILTE